MKSYFKGLSGSVENISTEEHLVAGSFTSDSVDVDGHIIYREDIVPRMIEYVEWGNIRDNHKEAVGSLRQYDPIAWNQFVVSIADDDVWKKIVSGVYKGFSIGIRVDEAGVVNVPLSQISEDKYNHLPQAVIKRLKKNGFVTRIKDFYISEISITDRPKNTKSKISWFKSEDGLSDELLPSSFMGESMEEENVVDIEENKPVVEEIQPVDIAKSEDEAEIVADVVVVENVAEQNVEIAKGETNEDVATADMQHVFDSEKAIDELHKAIGTLTDLVKSMSDTVNGAFANLNSALVSKSEMETVVPFDAESFKSDIRTAVKSELVDFVKSEEMTLLRGGSVNVGETPEAKKANLDFSTLGKSEQYSAIAEIIARSIKK